MEESSEPSGSPGRFCTACGEHVPPEGACPTCEQRAMRATTPVAHTDTSGVKPALILYFVYLSTLALGSIVYSILADQPGAAGKVEIGIELFDTALILVWALFRRKDVLPALRRVGPWWAYLLAACFAPLTFTLASLALQFLRIWLGVQSSSSFGPLAGAGFGPFAVVLAVAVQPAVIEELAFRGMIQPALARGMSTRDAVLAASAMFAIMHLSIPSFVHLMMLGIAVGWLRAISGSLYPSMLLHFLHNTTVLVTDGLFSTDTQGAG